MMLVYTTYFLIHALSCLIYVESKPNSLQEVLSRITVFMTNDTNLLINDLKKEDEKILSESLHSNNKNDPLDSIEKMIPKYGRHIKKLDTKYNLKFNLLSHESQQFVIEIENLIPNNLPKNNEIFEDFINNTVIPKYLTLTNESKLELKNFFNKSIGIKLASARSGL
uniref:Fatty-acid and retinol-binding protein 1 n=1 Tax=Parastrongyloides trichosuri TaxID=131310 RepID=A0A0N4ZW24_PARTI